MRESTFIDKNVKRWEETNKNIPKNPDEISSDFIDLMNDFSYSQTHFPHSKINEYLNTLSSRVYRKIFLRQRKGKNPIAQFWVHDFPTILGHNRKVLWFATAYFLLFCVLGYVFSNLDPNFVNGILGENYIEMTEKNIQKGEPFGVYGSANPLMMFFQIFTNNARVGMLVFLAGILLGIGAAYLTFTNGIMVGAFLSLFIKHQLGFDAIFVVMLHGTIELTGLILEFTAGILLGLSFLVRRNITMKQAFRRGLTEGAKIYIGTIPFTFLAAVIESFVTYLGKGGFNSTTLPVIMALSVIFVGSWVFVVWYFYLYPIKKAAEMPYSDYLSKILA